MVNTANSYQRFGKRQLNAFLIFFLGILAVVLLLNLSGILPLSVGMFLLRFWPIFLIMGLLQYFLRKSPVANLITASLGVGIILSIIFFSSSQLNRDINSLLLKLTPVLVKVGNLLGIEPGNKLSSQISIKADKYQDVEKREVRIVILTGTFTLSDSVSDEHLIINSQYYEKFGKPKLKEHIMNNTLTIDLQTQKAVYPVFGLASDVKYDISMGNTQIPTSLDIRGGASNLLADFSDLKMNSLNIVLGAGNGEVTISKNSLPEKIDIDVGAGKLKLILPFDAFAKINYYVGVGSLKVNSESFSANGSYTIPKFKIQEDPFEINVDLGAGSVLIETTGEN